MTRWAWHGVFALWLWGVAAGSAYAWRYSLTTGGASPVQRWPAAAVLTLDHALPTLVMFVMANCPCSVASLHELNALLADTRVRAQAYVVVEPPSLGDPGRGEDLLAAAHTVRHTQAIDDPAGAVRRSFAARTSGEAHLYAPSGQLLFKGGITAARGHEGLSRSRYLLASLLSGELAPKAPIESPVYGCHFAQNEVSDANQANEKKEVP